MYFQIAVMFYLTNFISASLITPRRGYQGPPDASWPSSAGPWGKFFVVSRSLGQGFLVYWIHTKVCPDSLANFCLHLERLWQNKLFEFLALCIKIIKKIVHWLNKLV